MPSLFLAGDRNIGTRYGWHHQPGSEFLSRTPSPATSWQAIGTNTLGDDVAAWTGKIHQNQGNVGLADGSVQQMTVSRLASRSWPTRATRALHRASFRLSKSTVPTPATNYNRLLFPGLPEHLSKSF